MPHPKLILDYIYQHEFSQPDRLYLTQPFDGGKTVSYTWREVLDQARRMASHLRSQGLGNGDRIAILSKNCAHFFMAELAIWMSGCTTVAIYPTESAQTVRFVLDHCEAKLLFVGKLDDWSRQKQGVPDGLACMALPLSNANELVHWDDVVKRYPPLAGTPARAGDDIALIAYTSGSTGQPKGVMHSFEGITRATEGYLRWVKDTVENVSDQRVLSYLPLAHVLERAFIECASLVSGTIHVFFAESLDTFLADLQRARPTSFVSVPRLWLKFQQGVFTKISPRKLDLLLSVPVLGRKVGRKILTGLGLDHVEVAGSGSAPIPADLLSWYRRLGLRLMEGYAMSEDFAYSHVSTRQYNEPGYVGVPYPDVRVRIDVDGEILIQSPGRLAGYYKQPELYAACLTDDGYFRTGDLGEIRSDGLLKITGRKKELFKTAKGKYVAPAPIENRLNAHPMVELSLVSGVGEPSAYAMVLLAENLRPQSRLPAQRADIERELSALLHTVNKQLADHEQLRMLVVQTEPWSIDNGCLTPTMKIKRGHIETRVAEQVARWYAAPGPVVWA